MNITITDNMSITLDILQKVLNGNDNVISTGYQVNIDQLSFNNNLVYNSDDYYVLKTANNLSMVVPQNSQDITYISDSELQQKYNNDYLTAMQQRIDTEVQKNYRLIYPGMIKLKRLLIQIKSNILNNPELLKQFELDIIKELNAKYYDQLMGLEQTRLLSVQQQNILYNYYSIMPDNSFNPINSEMANNVTVHYIIN
jgi:hypothetical protein